MWHLVFVYIGINSFLINGTYELYTMKDNVPFTLLLADDATDHCQFLEKALKNTPIINRLRTVCNGE